MDAGPLAPLLRATQLVGCSLLDGAPPPLALAPLLPFGAMWYLGEVGVAVELPREAPTVAQLLTQLALCGAAGDLLHYATHRLLHHRLCRARIHSVHHASPALHSWVVLEVHPLEVVVTTAAIYGPLLLFAHPLVTWVFAVLATAHTVWAHSGREGVRLAPLLLTAGEHRVHHDVDATRNFGNVLRVWDVWFGTYAAGHGTVRSVAGQ